MTVLHKPVLIKEVIKYLNPKPGDIIIDGTLGYGGHTEEISGRLEGQGYVVGFDLDPEALSYCREKFNGWPVKVVESNFNQIKEILGEMNITEINGVLLDLGVSSPQLDFGERGFSIMREGPLNMRFDKEDKGSVLDLLHNSSEEELKRIFKKFGEEKFSGRIARAIKKALKEKSIGTTSELSECITNAIPAKSRNRTIHPATKVFQALRIAVNRELENLEDALPDAIDMLAPGGRLAVISYHSLEDRIVKHAFQESVGQCKCPPGLPICRCGAEARIKILTKKPVCPGEKEIEENPRSRSAKLRVAEKLDIKDRPKEEFN